MVKYGNKCEYFGCGRWSQVDRHLSFFRFPSTSEKRCIEWALLMNRPDLLKLPIEKLRTRYVCARHFPDHAFMNELRNRKTHDATPLPYRPPGAHTLPKLPQVEFKPEMWEEGKEKNSEDKPPEVEAPPVKRPRGRPRKHFNNNTRLDGSVVIKSEVVSCCALACPNTSESFIMNCLPRDPVLRKIWVKKIDRLDWSPDEDSALCEIHFEPEMWDHDMGEEKILKLDAVPSLFLHGEAIKSWVTLDNSGNIEKIVVDGQSTNDENSNSASTNDEIEQEEASESEEEEEEEPDVFVKHEALEPEIDMVEGSEEDMVSREAISTEEQFETIYCDSTFNDQEENFEDEIHKDKEIENDAVIIPRSMEEENPLGPDSILPDERSSSPILQDEEVSCLEDSSSKSLAIPKIPGRLTGETKYLVLSRPVSNNFMQKKIIKRRSSSQLGDEFQCPICDRRLSRRKNLEIHIEKLHPYGEISEYQKKRKEVQIQQEEIAKKPEEPKKTPTFKKPPPALKPIIPHCLLSPSIPTIPLIPFTSQNALMPPTQTNPAGVLNSSIPVISLSSQSPLVSSSIQASPGGMVAPTLVTSQSIVAPSALVSPQNLVPSSSPTLIATSTVVTTPRPLDPSPAGGEVKKQFLLLLPKQAVVPPQSTTAKEQPACATDESEMYSVNLAEIPLDKRLRLKDKLRELVDAVVKKNLNPEKIIIAYDRT